jgi:hypothetical protein
MVLSSRDGYIGFLHTTKILYTECVVISRKLLNPLFVIFSSEMEKSEIALFGKLSVFIKDQHDICIKNTIYVT